MRIGGSGWRCGGWSCTGQEYLYIYIYISETPSWLQSSDGEPVHCNGMTGCRGGRGVISASSMGSSLDCFYSVLVWFAAASSPDGHGLTVLVEASPAAVDVGVGGRRHWLLPGPDRLGWRREGRGERGEWGLAFSDEVISACDVGEICIWFQAKKVIILFSKISSVSLMRKTHKI